MCRYRVNQHLIVLCSYRISINKILSTEFITEKVSQNLNLTVTSMNSVKRLEKVYYKQYSYWKISDLITSWVCQMVRTCPEIDLLVRNPFWLFLNIGSISGLNLLQSTRLEWFLDNSLQHLGHPFCGMIKGNLQSTCL